MCFPHGSCPRQRRLGGPYDVVVQVEFVVPGALPELLEQRACGIARQRLGDIFVRAANDCETRLDLRARSRVEKCESLAKVQLEIIAGGDVARGSWFTESRGRCVRRR